MCSDCLAGKLMQIISSDLIHVIYVDPHVERNKPFDGHTILLASSASVVHASVARSSLCSLPWRTNSLPGRINFLARSNQIPCAEWMGASGVLSIVLESLHELALASAVLAGRFSKVPSEIRCKQGIWGIERTRRSLPSRRPTPHPPPASAPSRTPSGRALPP